jgi:hypothetical protein
LGNLQKLRLRHVRHSPWELSLRAALGVDLRRESDRRMPLANSGICSGIGLAKVNCSQRGAKGM